MGTGGGQGRAWTRACVAGHSACAGGNVIWPGAAVPGGGKMGRPEVLGSGAGSGVGGRDKVAVGMYKGW